MINFFVQAQQEDDFFSFDGYTLAGIKNEDLINGDDAFDPSDRIEVNLAYPLKEHRTVTLHRVDVGWTKQAFAECISDVFRYEWNNHPENFSIEDYQEFVLISAEKGESGVWHLNIIADKFVREIKPKKEVKPQGVPPWVAAMNKPARKR